MELNTSLLKRLVRLVAGYSLLINLLWLAPALFSLQVFDRVLSSQSRETLLMLLVGVGLAFCVTGVLEYFRGRLQAVMGNIVNDALSPEIARITLAESAKRQGPVSMEGLRDVARLRNLFSAQGLVAVLDAPWAIVFLIVISMAHPWLGMAAGAAAVIMFGLAILNDQLTKGSMEELQREAGKSQRYLEQAMHNAEVAQALGMGNSLLARWRKQSAQVASLQGPASQRAVAMATFTRVFRQAVQVLMQSLGAYLVLNGDATSGVLVASTTLMGKALQPIEQIVGSWKVLAEGRLAYRRLSTMSKGLKSKPEAMSLPAPLGQLTATGLVYRPPNSDRVILGGISLHLEAGESLAILGPSGSGKSTLVRMLTGLWSPTAGSVRLDGVELSKWSREEVGPHIGYLPQDVELFSGTVAENIARLREISAPMVVEAAQLAGVHELILALPEGYDTVIDQHAALLSPGQRQRIALARALYGNPQLVVLDEPNANLDGAGEVALGETLKKLRGKSTVIVVTHRTNLTAHVGKLMVVEGGRVSHYGPVQEVMAALQAPRQQTLPAAAMAALAAQAAQSAQQPVAAPRTNAPTLPVTPATQMEVSPA
jgi:PrtD family type I secretion system ABC transporter